MTAGCLEESTVLAFLGGTLPPDDRTAVEAHVAACGACADLVTWAAADQASSTDRLPGHEGRPFVGQLQPGARVGRYQVLGAVGRGGMGEVYAAYHPDLDRRIAVKVVHGAGGNTAERRVRLLREARAIARLRHPNVVTVHDAGTFGDRVFIAMELIDGVTIEQWLSAERRTWQQIVDVFVAAGRGLAAAHAAGVVHRDFKPQNVMIAKDGSVRVMDFGLARLAEDEAPDPRAVTDEESTVSLGPLTKTGAFIGTPAYMSPEQFRREKTDARSDQFSFCVALHEALFGSRPAGETGEGGSPVTEASIPTRSGGVPGWLRGIVRKGASTEREKRYPSMDALLSALDRGRSRLRRHGTATSVGLAVLLVAGGGWRISRGNHFICAVPRDRVEAAWSNSNAASPRRQAIHRAFVASGRPTAETSWQRVSAALDEYIGQWSVMYMESCEATHIRGEQSSEVLDLRMSCLNDNLDQIRALTDALATADAAVVSLALGAVRDLTPVERCADVALLKSAVPLPKADHTFREVQRLRRLLTEGEALLFVGRPQAALEKLSGLRREVEATGYKPLLGELLTTVGHMQSQLQMRECVATLEDAVFTAESVGDDTTAAKAATLLIHFVGVNLGRVEDSERWARLANSILDRHPAGSVRTRAWVANNLSAVYSMQGQLEKALTFNDQAIALKEEALGKEHPDVAISLGGRAWILAHLGRPTEAISYADRALSIYAKAGDANNPLMSDPLSNKGWALLALGRLDDAKRCFEDVIEVFRYDFGFEHPAVAEALIGLGEVRLAKGDPVGAVQHLEAASGIWEKFPGQEFLQAINQFALARALWDSGGDRRRARALAEAARRVYASIRWSEKARACSEWLAAHRR